MNILHYTVVWSDEAKKQLCNITDKRVQSQIIQRCEKLVEQPDKQGKALIDDLANYRSIHAVGQRYRIIYRIENAKVIVIIFAVGIRKEGSKGDIYSLAKKLIKLGLVK